MARFLLLFMEKAMRKIEVLVLIILLLQGTGCRKGVKVIGDSRNTPFLFTSVWEMEGRTVLPVDINGDGEDEYLTSSVDLNYFELIDANFQVYDGSSTLPPAVNVSNFFDFNRDGFPEIFVTWRGETIDSLWVIDVRRNRLDRKKYLKRFETLTGKDLNKDGFRSWATGVVGLLDVNGDDSLDIVTEIETGQDLEPRGIVVYDHSSGKILWKFLIGASPDWEQREIVLEDIAGDGNPEIIFGTRAHYNGADLNGFDDCQSYIIVLDKYGKLLWSRVVARTFSHSSLEISDLDGDGEKEIIGIGESIEVFQVQDTLFLFNGQTGEVKKSRGVGNKLRGLILTDLQGDGKEEIIVGNSDGWIRIFDENLLPMDSALVVIPSEDGMSPKEVSADKALDMDGDGDREILARDVVNRLFLLDQNLDEIAYLDNVSWCYQMFVVHSGRKARPLINESTRSYLLTIKKNTFSPTLIFFSGAVIFLGSIILLLIFASLRYRKTANLNLAYTRQLTLWAETSQELAHQIKTPLTTLKLSLERLSKPNLAREEMEQSTESMLEEVNRLRKTSDSFMKLAQLKTPDRQPTDINALLKDVLKKFEDLVSERIRLNLELTRDLPEIRIDREQVRIVFENIIENSICAMDSEGTLTVESSLNQEFGRGRIENAVAIEIHDTGKGVSKEDLEKIFKPFYTKKEGGTGLGLTIARKIIEDHGGKITIESKEKIGTTVTILIPFG